MSTDDNLDNLLRSFLLDTKNLEKTGSPLEEAKASIKAEALRIALEIIPKKIRVNSSRVQVANEIMREIKMYEASAYNQAIDDVIKAFEDRYKEDK